MSKIKIHTITMPKWGLTMEKGTIASWLIEEGMVILEVDTDKIVQPIEGSLSGVLRQNIANEEGTRVCTQVKVLLQLN
jgi:pyruvate dehydrogenase E2 component (dihydrolipoyllysine-residue acetyltransferase)